jgi:hypothetical protein
MHRYTRGVFALGSALALVACEDGTTTPSATETFEVTIRNVSAVFEFAASGMFTTPAGQAEPGPLLPGGVYEFDFDAAPGMRLSFATMFVQSNDFFYAPDGEGIPLWDDAGQQVTGDVTHLVYLWDAGTEADEEPGLGDTQAPRQAGPDTGASDDDSSVRRAADTFGNLPAVTEVLRVTLHSTGATSFRARIENLSDAGTLATSDGMTHPVPLAPGVWVVHGGPDPLFTEAEADRGEGLEGLAEDGSVAGLAGILGERTGLTSPIAPGVFVVHTTTSLLFHAGMPDAGMGLEALAEDGDPSGLVDALGANPLASESDAFTTPAGASTPAPAFPGEAYVFTFTAEPGDRLSFATMLVQSNDLFFAPAETGIDLFPSGTPLNGDLTGMVLLWDAGTEVNEMPGVGLNQAPRQTGPDTGPDEGGSVRQVNDGYRYPEVGDVIQVTIRPLS